MRQLTEVGIEPRQVLNVVGENNERITLTLNFKPSQFSWYFSIQYLDFTLNETKLVNSPNFMRQYIDILPFGMSCIVADGTDPYSVDDFVEGRVILNLLTEEDVQLIETEIFA